MADQVCPECGCDIADAFDMGGVIYCCETCATNCEGEYGCIDEPWQTASRSPKKRLRRASH
jgi:hypothetical protein